MRTERFRRTIGPGLVMAVLALSTAPFAAQTRDATATAPAPTGRATISGVVVADDTPATPVRRALVTVGGAELRGGSRTVITEDDGTFSFTDLPAGRYSLTATKPAHLTASFGAARPGRQGSTISLEAAAHVTATLRMARAAVLTGVVRDASGRPMPDVQILTVDPVDPRPSGPVLGPTGVMTNDRGEYRVFGLAPGEYVVMAIPRSTRGDAVLHARSDAEVDAVLAGLERRGAPGSAPIGAPPRRQDPTSPGPAIGFAPLYFPGTPIHESATRLRLAAGDIRTSVDFSVAPVPMTTIEGTVVSGDGLAVTNVQLSVSFAGSQFSVFQGTRPILTEPPGDDGRFRYTNIAPGRYRIMARATPGPVPDASTGRGGGVGGGVTPAGARGGAVSSATRYGAADVEVNGQDVSGVVLPLTPGATFSGRVVFDGIDHSAPADLGGLRVSLSPPGGTSYSVRGSTIIGNTFNAAPAVTPNADGTFQIVGLAPGTYLLQATIPRAIAADWWFRSALADDRDLLDLPLVVGGAESFTGVRLTFADRRSELAGTLATPAGAPAPDFFVVVFPADRDQWTEGSRRIRTTRPATDGVFSVLDLPAGDYLVGALTDVEPRDLVDKTFLEQLAAASIPVTIRNGERTVQDIRIAR